jgi:hypothetical protein
MTIENNLKIDLLDLANDAAMQPTLYHQWAVKYAEAHSAKVKIRERARVEKIRLKQILDERRAELDLTIRENWESYSVEKKTEGGVTAMLSNHADFKKAQDEYLIALSQLNQELADATHEDLIMEAARDAMQQRQQSIKTAAELYLGGYFSETTKVVDADHQLTKESSQRVQQKMRAQLLKKRGT